MKKEKKEKKLFSLPLWPGALLRVRRGLGARPPGQEEPREQDDVGRDQHPEREAEAAPRKVERFPHFIWCQEGRGREGGKKKTATRRDRADASKECFAFIWLLSSSFSRWKVSRRQKRKLKSVPCVKRRAVKRRGGVERERKERDWCFSPRSSSSFDCERMDRTNAFFFTFFFLLLSLLHSSPPPLRIQIQARV